MLERLSEILHEIETSTAPQLFIVALVCFGMGVFQWFDGTKDVSGLSGDLTNLGQVSASHSQLHIGDYAKADITSSIGPYHTKTKVRYHRSRRHRTEETTYYYLVPVNQEHSNYITVEVEEGERSLFDTLSGTLKTTESHPIQGAIKSLPDDAQERLTQLTSHLETQNMQVFPYCLRYETLDSARFTTSFARYCILGGLLCLAGWVALNLRIYKLHA